jgi:hypothetical protein
MSTAAFVTSNVLRRGATRFACKLGETGLMDQMPPTYFDADSADSFQALDQAEHGGGLSDLRHLLQPGEPAQIGRFPTLCERVEPRALFSGQALQSVGDTLLGEQRGEVRRRNARARQATGQ